MSLIIATISALIVLSMIIYIFIISSVKKRKLEFAKNGIPYLPINLKRTFQFITGKKNIIHVMEELLEDLREMKAPLVATHDVVGQVCVIPCDLDLLRKILVKDFNYFVNRRPLKTSGIFRRFLFNMDDDHWKGIRGKLSPAFTTGKIRKMSKIFSASGDRLVNYLEREMADSKSMEFDFTGIFSKYAMDVIATCCFGVDSKSWECAPNETSYFQQMGAKIGFRISLKTVFRVVTMVAAPKIADTLGIDIIDAEAQEYFRNVIHSVVKQRRQTGERQEDFLQLMLDAQAGLLKNEENEEANQVVFEDEDIVANSLLFFNGGFDPTLTPLVFTLYSLALHDDVQNKLFEEVKTVLERHNGELSYETISDLTYLDMVINETMRFYPSAPHVDRVCNKDYHIDGSEMVIKKGELVLIPIHSIHMNSENYPNPKDFIPERFTVENKATRHPYAFLPFGLGPRNCIAMRFGMIKVKTAIAQLVSSFKIDKCSKTLVPMEYDNSISVKPKGGMWLTFTKRERNGQE